MATIYKELWSNIKNDVERAIKEVFDYTNYTLFGLITLYPVQVISRLIMFVIGGCFGVVIISVYAIIFDAIPFGFKNFRKLFFKD